MIDYILSLFRPRQRVTVKPNNPTKYKLEVSGSASHAEGSLPGSDPIIPASERDKDTILIDGWASDTDEEEYIIKGSLLRHEGDIEVATEQVAVAPIWQLGTFAVGALFVMWLIKVIY